MNLIFIYACGFLFLYHLCISTFILGKPIIYYTFSNVSVYIFHSIEMTIYEQCCLHNILLPLLFWIHLLSIVAEDLVASCFLTNLILCCDSMKYFSHITSFSTLLICSFAGSVIQLISLTI